VEYDAVESGRILRTVQRNVLPPTSGTKGKLNRQIASRIQRYYVPRKLQ
jgi:hypothetical protein